MSGFNPNANGVLGVEWPVTVESAYAIDSPTKSIGAAVLSTAADTVDKASVYVVAPSFAVYCMEVWPLATVTESPAVSTSTFRPNEDVTITFSGETIKLQTGADATLGTAYPVIDEATLDTSDYLRTDTASIGRHGWQGRYNVGSGGLASKQILSLTVSFINQTSISASSVAFTVVLNIGGVEFESPNLLARDTQRTVSHTWYYNPSTNAPWTIADIEAFDTSDEIGFYTYGTSAFYTKVYQGWIDVEHVPEQRLAFGTTGASAGWAEFNLSTPTGGTTWSKANGTEYLFTVRQISPLAVSFRYLDSGVDCPNGNHGYLPQFSGTDGRLLELGAEYTRAFALIITTSAPATSVDSQPYAKATMEAVRTGRTVEQEILGVAASYGVVKFVVSAQSSTPPTANLLVKVKKRSDNSQIGTTMTLTAADLTGTITTPRQVTVSMSATALTAVQEYLEFSSTAADGTGWKVAVLDTDGTGSTATYGSTTQCATVAGSESTAKDVAALLAQIPTAPTNLAASVLTQSSTTLKYVHLTWTATALGANFDHYELERMDANDSTWRQIAEITTEATAAFDDYEARRGVLSSYRLRVVHINTIASAYTSTVTATATVVGKLIGLVSNESPTLNLAYNDASPRTYQFNDHPVVIPLYDRDGAAAFNALESRGDSFPLTLYIGRGTFNAPPATGRAAFTPLRDLCRAQLSYVCVLDTDGNRWFASVDLIDGARVYPEEVYTATVQVRWLTDTPSTPDA